MKEIVGNEKLIAGCGLYCGACKKYLKEKCPGCRENKKAAWCHVRQCCIENDYASCAECSEFDNIAECVKFNNFISKIFSFIFRSNRQACIEMIKEMGPAVYAQEMADNKAMTIKR